MPSPDSPTMHHAAVAEQLPAFVDQHREMLLHSLDGLTEAEARARLVPSATTLLGLVKHAAFVERVATTFPSPRRPTVCQSPQATATRSRRDSTSSCPSVRRPDGMAVGEHPRARAPARRDRDDVAPAPDVALARPVPPRSDDRPVGPQAQAVAALGVAEGVHVAGRGSDDVAPLPHTCPRRLVARGVDAAVGADDERVPGPRSESAAHGVVGGSGRLGWSVG